MASFTFGEKLRLMGAKVLFGQQEKKTRKFDSTDRSWMPNMSE